MSINVQGYLALGTGAAGAAFAEQSGNGYPATRQAVSMVAASGNVGTLTYSAVGPATGSAWTITQMAIYDAPSGGNLLLRWQEPSSVTVGTTTSFAAGSITFTLAPMLFADTPATQEEVSIGTNLGTTSLGTPVSTGNTAGVLISGGTVSSLNSKGATFANTYDQPFTLAANTPALIATVPVGIKWWQLALNGTTPVSITRDPAVFAAGMTVGGAGTKVIPAGGSEEFNEPDEVPTGPIWGVAAANVTGSYNWEF